MDKAESLVAVDDVTPGTPPAESASLASPPPESAAAETPAAVAPEVRADPPALVVPPAPPAPSMPSRDDIARLLDGAVDRITAAFQARAKSESFQQELITRLHNDLQDQVNRSAVLPVVTGLLRLQEEMEKAADRLRASPGALTPERMLQQFAEFAEDLGTLLEQAGVVRFVDEAQGDQFNGSRQNLLGRDPTADPALNHRISARVRPGADFGKTLLRREAVRVYAFDPGAPAQAAVPPVPPSTSESLTP